MDVTILAKTSNRTRDESLARFRLQREPRTVKPCVKATISTELWEDINQHSWLRAHYLKDPVVVIRMGNVNKKLGSDYPEEFPSHQYPFAVIVLIG